MNQPSNQTLRRHSAPFTLAAGALAVSLLLAACGGGDPSAPPDTTPPTVAITDNVPGTAAGAVTFTFTFSEDVGTSFTAEDVTVDGGTAGAFTKVGATVYTLVVTPPANATGNVTVSVAPAKFKDLALNDNTTSVSVAQAYDTTTAPPPASGTVLASFDEATPLAFSGFDGAQSSSIAAGPAGGTGLTAKIIRLGGEVWAGAKVNVGVIPLTATNNTISARVYSAVAGVPMVLKLENATDAGINTGDIQATEAVVAGWQTLTWVVPAAKVGPSYSWVVMLPNLGTRASADPGETYYFDDITLLGAAPPPPTATVLASFDETTPLAFSGFDGAQSSSIAAGPAGGTGLAAKIIRLGGEVWAGAKVNVGVIPLTTTSNTISARVHSPVAGVPMVLKLENATDAGINTGDIQATEAVVAGWQTLTWVVPAAKVGPSYSWVVMLPNLGTRASADPGETYYFDDIKLLDAGGGTGGGTANPTAAQGSFGPVAIPVLTSPDTMGFAGTGDALFAGDYVGALDANNNHAGWTGAVTRGLANNGNIGYFQDTGLSTSPQKLEENGWIASLLDNPAGVPSLFRFFILRAPASTFASSYMGLFANAPNNGTVNVSSYGSIKFRAWGPAEMYQQGNFSPTLEITLAGAKVDGCAATGSGGTEIKKSFVADQKIGAASTYKLPLAAWTVVGVCGADTNATAVASVLGALARVVVVVPGTSFNFTNLNSDGTTYATGLNLGPIAFTNN